LKTLLFNDTSGYHSGCAKVIEYLTNKYDVIGTVRGNIDRITYDQLLFDQAEHIVINGEGTMHSNRRVPLELLDVLVLAHKQGKKTSLINTVFQEITLSKTHINALQQTYISTREVMSQRYLKEHSIDSELHLDCSFFVDVPVEDMPKQNLVLGVNYANGDIATSFSDYATVNIFKQEWNHIVNVLRNSRLLITSRHHEMYAACKARCPFLVIEGNTWKSQALFETAGADIPYVKHTDQLVQAYIDIKTYWSDYKLEYEKLFDWMEQQPEL
jgi:polysaccharide pyruvyl transferase WcaK-like protein